jgi:hypothetical protein
VNNCLKIINPNLPHRFCCLTLWLLLFCAYGYFKIRYFFFEWGQSLYSCQCTWDILQSWFLHLVCSFFFLAFICCMSLLRQDALFAIWIHTQSLQNEGLYVHNYVCLLSFLLFPPTLSTAWYIFPFSSKRCFSMCLCVQIDTYVKISAFAKCLRVCYCLLTHFFIYASSLPLRPCPSPSFRLEREDMKGGTKERAGGDAASVWRIETKAQCV